MVVSRNSPELESSLPKLLLTWSLSFVALDFTQGIAVVYAVLLHPHSDFGWKGGGGVVFFRANIQYRRFQFRLDSRKVMCLRDVLK